jgi:GNAT superfamily N-acetyltransferase
MENGDYHIDRGDGTAARKILEDMTELYVKIYAEPPYNSGPLYQRDAFIARTIRQIGNDDFVISWAISRDGDLIGYAFGLPFEAGSWWKGDASSPPAEILQSRKFAVIELIVDSRWRGRGIGRGLLNDLLKDQPEKFAILTADPEAPARQIYAHWGWEKIGTAQHTDEAPTMDQLVLRR